MSTSVHVCNTCATHMYQVFVMRAWVVGRDKHFTQCIVRNPAETHNGYVVNYLHVPAKTPTGRDTRRLTICIISPKHILSMTQSRRHQY